VGYVQLVKIVPRLQKKAASKAVPLSEAKKEAAKAAAE
jgi:hypothetical protein